MRELLPYLFVILTFFAIILNLLGLMQLIPLYITLPILFFCIYFTLFSFTHRNKYRGRAR
ncbi:hypothetical protein [Ornithinibacillus halotolerans]|uniref:Membrane protein YizD n=1 Tax=Ornithinibacillus halotolerans TaxID=1274357 RepID=A0A916W7V3_9BACI|nr:hypothetical protein [Ornithinibacillus halotolerans]GGA74089.1 hypothetical protein GCM10008025_17300 [Ornithinibacillus halotolerans]